MYVRICVCVCMGVFVCVHVCMSMVGVYMHAYMCVCIGIHFCLSVHVSNTVTRPVETVRLLWYLSDHFSTQGPALYSSGLNTK